MSWLSWIISNVVLASLLALAAWFVQRRLRWPAVARILWVLVLVKLVTPPLVSVPLVELPGTWLARSARAAADSTRDTNRVRDTFLWVLLAAWSAGAVATGWTGVATLGSISTTDCAGQGGAARVAVAGGAPFVGAFDSLPAGDSGSAGAIAAAGRCRSARPRMLLPMALIDQLDDSQRSRAAAARAGSHQARRPFGADAGVDGRRCLLVAAGRWLRSAGSCAPARKRAAMRRWWLTCRKRGAITPGCCWM